MHLALGERAIERVRMRLQMCVNSRPHPNRAGLGPSVCDGRGLDLVPPHAREKELSLVTVIFLCICMRGFTTTTSESLPGADDVDKKAVAR